jgi:hypothetical protein
MVYVAGLPRDQGMALAKVTGAAWRYSIGGRRDATRDEALSVVHEITRDPFLLGIALGIARADSIGHNGPYLDLLEAAGADLEVAALQEAEEREWLNLHHGGPRQG